MGSLDVQFQIENGNRYYALPKLNSEQDPDIEHKSSSAAVANIKEYWPSLSEAAANNAADFKKVLELVSKETQQDQKVIFTRVGQSEEALIHEAAKNGNAEIVKLIVKKVPHLLRKKGFNGDTVWHIAAKTGKVFDELYKLRNEFKNSIERSSHGKNSVKVNFDLLSLRDENEEKNTALHEALINRRKSMAHLLAKDDSDLPLYVNKREKSALYLAAEAGYVDLVKYMLEKAIDASKSGKLKFNKGKSIVHAAIMGKNIALLVHILDNKAKLIEKIHVGGRDVERRLTEIEDEEGMNPLHWAASIGFLQGVRYLLDKKIAMSRDKKQLYPIHWASMNGHVEVVKELLQHHRNLSNLVSHDGQNVLHLAAKHGKHNVVSHILHSDNTSELSYLINKRDAQKNTPLHLATIHWHPKVVSALTLDNRVDLKSVNEEGLTALDAAVLNMKGISSFQQWLTWQILKAAGASRATSTKDLNKKRTASMKAKPTNNTNYKIIVRALFLASIAVGLVSYETRSSNFAYDNNFDTFMGLTTSVPHIKSYTFALCNNVSICTSIVVMLALIWAHFCDANGAFTILRYAKPLLWMAVTMFTLASMPGVYPVGRKHHWLLDAVLTTGMALIVVFAMLFYLVCLPLPLSGNRILRSITYFPFSLVVVPVCDHFEEWFSLMS